MKHMIPNRSAYIPGTVYSTSYEGAAGELRDVGHELELRGTVPEEARVLGLIGDEVSRRISADYAQQGYDNEPYRALMKKIDGIIEESGLYPKKPGVA